MYINTRLARTGLILLSTTAVINAFSVSQTQSPVGQASALPLTRLQSHPSSIIANLSSSSSTLLSPTEYENQHYTNAVATGERIRRAAMFSLTIGSIIRSYYSKFLELSLQKALPFNNHLTEEEVELTWNEQHAYGADTLSKTIMSMQGFYVKAAQIISSRPDSIPQEYADALSVFTDDNDPLPVKVIKEVIEKELLFQRGEKFDDVFEEFDEVPLGSASVAQVHHAVLTKKYGGGDVAVKVQRPSIEDKLMGDVANLKRIAKLFRELSVNLPVDYYAIFTELEEQLKDEFDFEVEAASMERMHKILTTDENGEKRESPVVTPRPIPALVSKRVLVMEFLKGVPLSRASDEMKRKGIAADDVEVKLFARKLLKSLTTAFGWSILESGFFHADAHPGNIFILDDGRIGLIDFGQVKQVNSDFREAVAKVILALDARKSDDNPDDLVRIGTYAAGLGIELKDDVPAHGHAVMAMWLFDGSVETYPDGYDESEMSPNSPLKAMKDFPKDIVLLARSTVLVKGMAKRFGIRWSLSQEWAPIAKRVLKSNTEHIVEGSSQGTKLFRLKSWGKQKATKVVNYLPGPIKKRVLSAVLHHQESSDAKLRTMIV